MDIEKGLCLIRFATMRFTNLLVATFIPAFLCLVFSGCDTANVVADNQQMNKSKLTNVNLKSHSVQTETCNNANCENEDDCCGSLNPSVDNDFVPGAVNSQSQASGKRFVAAMRVWRDVDDLYSTNAELISVAIDSREVKLLKDNGVTVTVPVSLLSQHDQNYIFAFVDECSTGQRTSQQIVEKFAD